MTDPNKAFVVMLGDNPHTVFTGGDAPIQSQRFAGTLLANIADDTAADQKALAVWIKQADHEPTASE